MTESDAVLTREVFLKRAALVGGAGLLAALDARSATAAGLRRVGAKAESGNLQVLDWSGYEVKPLWASYAVTHKDMQSNAARVGGLEPRDHPQSRGLATPGRTEQREELTIANPEVESADGDVATEPLADALEGDRVAAHGLGHESRVYAARTSGQPHTQDVCRAGNSVGTDVVRRVNRSRSPAAKAYCVLVPGVSSLG